MNTAMRPRYFPYIVLYGLGLTLFLSLLFNGFLLYNLSGKEVVLAPTHSIATTVSQKSSFWKQQFIECNRHNHAKDSVIQVLRHPPPSVWHAAKHTKN
jgi:hypothetical protein